MEAKPWIDTVTSYFTCCGKPASRAEILIEEATNEENSIDNELLQAERSLELQILQAEQRLSAINIVRQRTNEAIKKQEAKLVQPRKASSENSQVLVDKKKEIDTLKTKETRLTRKLGSVQKYNSSLSSELAALHKMKDSSASEGDKIRKEIATLSAELEKSKEETKKTNSQIQVSENKFVENNTQIDKLKAKVEELKKEMEFAASMRAKLGNVPTIPSRRGRSLYKGSTDKAPNSPMEEAAPPVPARSAGGLADRMKMFQ